MSEVKYYHVTETGIVEGAALGRINVVLGADYARVAAERDALQLRLNAADQRVDELVAAVRENHEWHKLYDEHDGYSDSGIFETNTKALAQQPAPSCPNCGYTEKDCREQMDHHLCGFPEPAPAVSIDDIPDFSPGNGNKARRRMAAIDALKPENQRIVPCNTEQRPDYFKCLKVD